METQDIRRIIFDLGGRKALAGQLNITHHAIQKWVINGRIPPKHWSDIVALTKDTRGPVTLEDLASAQSKGAAS